MLSLSVLDLSVVRHGGTTELALQHTTELARHADRRGFRRFWVAEHHNMATVASTTPGVLAAHLAAHTERIRIGSGGVMLPNHAPLAIAEQFAAGAAAAGFELARYDRPIEAWKKELFEQIDFAVTGTVAGLAETGTLVLWPDADEPRLMSLVPPLHIAILEADRLYENFAELIRAQDWASGMPTNALLISGPSKTADIEQTLAFGIHGPKALITLIIE